MHLVVRLLRRGPGVTVAGALIVALGVGATTTIFSVLYGVMLRPLPYVEPDRLVGIWTYRANAPNRVNVNPADQREWRNGTTVFEDVALANAPQNFNLIGAGDPERLLAARLSSGMLPLLRVRPALGRGFTRDEERPGNDRVVLLSDGLWRRRFGADTSIVGRTINLSGNPYEVVGVMPAGFEFPQPEHQLWIPLTINPRVLARQIATYDHVAVARLKSDVSVERAQQELSAIATRLAAAYPATNRGVVFEVRPLNDAAVRPVRGLLYALLAASLCLLAIAILNLANLLATRAISRGREFEVRLALGATRTRLALEALADVVPMLALGGIGGVVAAKMAVAAFVPIAPPALARFGGITVNGPVLVFSVVVLALTAAVTAILPATQTWDTSLVGGDGRSGGGTRRQARLRSALVVAQIALALPLVVGATSLARSFSLLMDVDPGFRPQNVLTLHMAIPRSKYTSDGAIAILYKRILDEITALPGVRSAAMVNRLPLTGNEQAMSIAFDEARNNPFSE